MILTKDPSTGRYILRVDSSIYKEMDCLRYIMLKLIQGYQQPSTGKSPVMEYGTAGHKFLEARYRGLPFEKQLEAATTHFSDPAILTPDGEWRNMGHLVSTLVGYDSFYNKNGDMLEAKDLEKRFTLPFFKTDLVEVLLCGTVDMRGDYCNQRVICDNKFTSAWNTYEYFAEYDLSPQLMIYKYVMDMIFGEDHGCMINGIFINKTKPATFKRSEVIRFSPEQVANLMSDFRLKVQIIVGNLEDMIRTGTLAGFKPNYCACIKRYGEKAIPCMFKLACTQPSFDEALSMAEAIFEKKEYNPETHQL